MRHFVTFVCSVFKGQRGNERWKQEKRIRKDKKIRKKEERKKERREGERKGKKEGEREGWGTWN